MRCNSCTWQPTAVQRDVSLDIAALLQRRPGKALVDLLRGKAGEPRAEGSGEGERHAGVVHVLIDQLVVLAHRRALVQVVRHQRRVGERLVEVVEDHRGLDHRPAVVDQGGNDARGVQLHVGRVELVAAQCHQVLAVLESLLCQDDAHLLGADGVHAVVELKH
jgi:hypothetical protein